MLMSEIPFAPAHAELKVRTLAVGVGFEVHDVLCAATGGRWGESEEAGGYALVLPRAGAYKRRVDGVTRLIDPMTSYFRMPGEVQQIAHPTTCGDRCTSIRLTAELIASVWGGSPEDLPQLLDTAEALAALHRGLIRECRSGADRSDVEEHVHLLVGEALRSRWRERVDSGRPTAAAARSRIVSEARAMISQDPCLRFSEIAGQLAVSPHHLSRVFTAKTGMSLTEYRNRLRARLAVERIVEGETSLSRLAADLGFADHAHMTRTVRLHTGRAPSAHRLRTRRADPIEHETSSR